MIVFLSMEVFELCRMFNIKLIYNMSIPPFTSSRAIRKEGNYVQYWNKLGTGEVSSKDVSSPGNETVCGGFGALHLIRIAE